MTGRTVTIKLRYTTFQTVTRAHSVPDPITSEDALFALGQHILESFFPLPLPIRLLGVTVSGLVPQHTAATQLTLSFDD